jgi:transcriptional regulator with XRE-family HTH domain
VGEPTEPVPRVLRQLATLRRKSGLSQARLAERIGTVQSAISELESNQTSPTLALLDRYASYFGMQLVVTIEGDVD